MTGEQGSPHASTLPSGVLTVMFTDLEESTLRWEVDAKEMRRVMDVHDEVLERAIGSHDGVVFKSTGDGVGAVFPSPTRAVDAAVTIQRQLQAVPWRRDRPRVRIGLHLGDISPTRGDYYGVDVNRAARIMDVANGDQIAVSDAVAEFIEPARRVFCGQHELRGIGVESIHLVRDDDLIDDPRPLRAIAVRRQQLPSGVVRSVGRTREVAEIAELLRSNRLVTIVGVGGVGKTHVGLAAGRQLEDELADGAVFVDLAAIRPASDVAPAVAAALGARLQPGLDLLASIADFVEGRELLVVLDNCEHVMAAVARVASSLLSASDVVVLATSRSSFNVAHEQVYPLRPLLDSDGVALFGERAGSRDPRLQPRADDAPLVATICAAVGGIPLGIELAAACVRVLSLVEIADRLTRSLDVVSPAVSPVAKHVAPQRQETLRSTIEWSYLQLGASEARLFDRLSVFMGGFAIEAAEEVCADEHLDGSDIAALLETLVDMSLVNVERMEHSRRFTILRPLQRFGAENLDERGETREISNRHADYYARAASRTGESLASAHEGDAWRFFAVEWSNLREAYSRSRAAGRTDVAVQLVLDLGWYSTLSLRSETFAWADDLLATTDRRELHDVASLLGLRALHKYFIVDDSRSDAETGLALDPGDPQGFNRIALGAVWVNNRHEAHESALWTTQWIDALTPTSPIMSRLWAHAMRAFHLGVHDPTAPEALVHVDAIDRIADETKSTSARALGHWARGMHLVSVALAGDTSADIGEGLREWRLGRELVRSFADVHLVDYLITSIELHTTAADGELDHALELARDALRRAQRHHYVAGTSHLFGVTAILLARTGRADLGRRLLPVMRANGHPPRQNAIDAVHEGEVGPSPDDATAVLSIHDAGQLADVALSDALGDRA